MPWIRHSPLLSIDPIKTMNTAATLLRLSLMGAMLGFFYNAFGWIEKRDVRDLPGDGLFLIARAPSPSELFGFETTSRPYVEDGALGLKPGQTLEIADRGALPEEFEAVLRGWRWRGLGFEIELGRDADCAEHRFRVSTTEPKASGWIRVLPTGKTEVIDPLPVPALPNIGRTPWRLRLHRSPEKIEGEFEEDGVRHAFGGSAPSPLETTRFRLGTVAYQGVTLLESASILDPPVDLATKPFALADFRPPWGTASLSRSTGWLPSERAYRLTALAIMLIIGLIWEALLRITHHSLRIGWATSSEWCLLWLPGLMVLFWSIRPVLALDSTSCVAALLVLGLAWWLETLIQGPHTHSGQNRFRARVEWGGALLVAGAVLWQTQPYIAELFPERWAWMHGWPAVALLGSWAITVFVAPLSGLCLALPLALSGTRVLGWTGENMVPVTTCVALAIVAWSAVAMGRIGRRGMTQPKRALLLGIPATLALGLSGLEVLVRSNSSAFLNLALTTRVKSVVGGYERYSAVLPSQDRNDKVNVYGRDHSREPAPETCRILCLGSSSIWGLGSSDPRRFSYPVQLEKALRRQKGVAAEVVRAGVPGAPFDLLEIWFNEVLLHMNPHVVVVYFGGNGERPELRRHYARVLSEARSAQHIDSSPELWAALHLRWNPPLVIDTFLGLCESRLFMGLVEGIDAARRSLAGEDLGQATDEDASARVVRACAERGIPVLLIPEVLLEHLRGMEGPHAYYTRFRGLARKNEGVHFHSLLEDYRARSLEHEFVSRFHQTDRGYAALAELIAAELDDRDLLCANLNGR